MPSYLNYQNLLNTLKRDDHHNNTGGKTASHMICNIVHKAWPILVYRNSHTQNAIRITSINNKCNKH